MITPDEEFFKHPIVNPRYLNKNYPEFFEYLNEKYPNVPSTSEKVYLWRYGLLEPPKCICCGGDVRFNGVSKGYSEYCSCKCSNNDYRKQEKSKQTCLKRYGTENPMQSKEVKDKFINYFSIPENQEKIRQERFEKYGVYHSGQLQYVKDKIKQTCLDKYGVESGVQLEKAKQNLHEARKKRQISRYEDIVDCGMVDGSWKYTCLCNHLDCNKCTEKRFNIEPQMYFDRKRDKTELCTILLPPRENSFSSLEVLIMAWLDEYNIKYDSHRRDLLGNGQEIDIYLPDYHIGIECNGEWYHCTKVKPNNYHIDKHILADKRGIQLLMFWGVWLHNYPDIVKSILLSKLGIYNTKIYARKCEIKEISSSICNKFLSSNHIQGPTKANIHLGLFYEGVLNAVMTFSKHRSCMGSKTDDSWELSRYCSLLNTQVIGGAGKLLKYFETHYHPTIIKSFSSNDISNGGLYKSLGFKTDGNINSSYWYYDLHKDKRYHRSAFTKAHLKELGWDDGRTEEEIMYDHHFFKNIDSGQTKWTKQI